MTSRTNLKLQLQKLQVQQEEQNKKTISKNYRNRSNSSSSGAASAAAAKARLSSSYQPASNLRLSSSSTDPNFHERAPSSGSSSSRNNTIPEQVLQVKTQLENPTRYHIHQKQRQQLANYLNHKTEDISDGTPSPTFDQGDSPMLGGSPLGSRGDQESNLTEEEVATLQKDRQKKDNHNQIERKRRYHINDKIKELGSLLPSGSSPRNSKGKILQASVDFIKDINDRDLLGANSKDSAEKLQRLEEENKQMKLKLLEYQKLISQHGLASVDLKSSNLSSSRSASSLAPNIALLLKQQSTSPASTMENKNSVFAQPVSSFANANEHMNGNSELQHQHQQNNNCRQFVKQEPLTFISDNTNTSSPFTVTSTGFGGGTVNAIGFGNRLQNSNANQSIYGSSAPAFIGSGFSSLQHTTNQQQQPNFSNQAPSPVGNAQDISFTDADAAMMEAVDDFLGTANNTDSLLLGADQFLQDGSSYSQFNMLIDQMETDTNGF